MAVYMSLPYRTRASVQPYPVVCTVARRPGQISGESGATKVKPKYRVRGAPYHPLEVHTRCAELCGGGRKSPRA